MVSFSSLPFLVGSLPESPGPLTRYLPTVPQAITTAWLSGQIEPGNWILDPFGASPLPAVEAARAGYRVLVAVNNPVTRFFLEMAANPPRRGDFQAALAELAASRKGAERLETHLQSLYLTGCSKCQKKVPAEAFIWERGKKKPVLVARLVNCPQCKDSGEYEVTSEDLRRVERLDAADGLHRSRALQRVTSLNDPDSVHAEEALDHYLPRAVYALITVINRLEGLRLSAERQRCLTALVLAACDEANSLWPYPTERPRPKQLTIPPRFFEHNVWRSLERGVDIWPVEGPSVPVTFWPELPPEGRGICLFEGRLRDLVPCLEKVPVRAVLSALPRPNQAFWTLSALWAGWLWGREAVTPFKGVLRRRRYDWTWHATALYAALKRLSPHLALSAPFFGVVAEPETAYLSAVILAAEAAGFDLRGIAMRTANDPVQILWHRRPYSHPPTARPDVKLVREALQGYLNERGEPVTYLHIYAACLEAMSKEQALNWRDEELLRIHASIQETLAEDTYVHYSQSENPETGLWGLRVVEQDVVPLPDRVELSTVHFLQHHPGCTFDELEASILNQFPGLLTPSLALIRSVVDSYAIEEDGRWRLRPEDLPETRRADLKSMRAMLKNLAQCLGYSTVAAKTSHHPFLWQEKGETAFAFYIQVSSVIARILRQNQYPPERNFLIIPGGRASLLAYKLRRDPSLATIMESGWRVLKFRQLRRLADIPDLKRAAWEKGIAGDPIEPPEQMKLF